MDQCLKHIKHCLINFQALIEQCFIFLSGSENCWAFPHVVALLEIGHAANTARLIAILTKSSGNRMPIKIGSFESFSLQPGINNMGRRSDHSREELQTLIVDATLLLVKQNGASKVTARQIARAVGYTPGMLYSIFTNLQDIFLHVNAEGVQTLFSLCIDAQRKNGNPDEAIQAMGLAYLKFAEGHTHQFDLMFSRQTQATTAGHSSPGLTGRISSLFELVEEELRKLNAKATDEQVKLGARALWSGVHGTAALRLSDQLYHDNQHADRKIVRALIGGFLASWQLP